ncbi:MAG: alpha/beta hydrolase [Armatimonadetes bacterium]|nr:alpha/beta hydrolase [Armatimonadota bacterium]
MIRSDVCLLSVASILARPFASLPAASRDSVTLGAASSVGLVPPPAVSNVHDVQVVKRMDSSKWAWIELLRDPHPAFVQRNFHPRQTQRNEEAVAAFGTDKPHSGDVLLQYAGDPPPGVKVHDTPVVLVHGASKDGNFWWDPHEDGTDQGLPQRLRDQGFQVYAVSFAHNHDDNNFWTQQVSNAVDRVKTLTGAEKVDLVGHSKGGFATRQYVSNLREPWMTPYRGDVRRAVFVGAPLGGIDYGFRHPVANYALFSDTDDPRKNAPMSWDHIMVFGFMRDARELGYSQTGPDYWPGQRQMLARMDDQYPLSSYEPDTGSTYNGGRGFVSDSRGIDHFIAEGGNFVKRLHDAPIDPSVEVAVLAGNRPNIPGILNEYTGPSDGLLMLSSALDVPDDANVVAEEVLPLHHKAIVSDARGQEWIAGVLRADSLPTIPKARRQAIREAALAEGKKLCDEETPDIRAELRDFGVNVQPSAALPELNLLPG